MHRVWTSRDIDAPAADLWSLLTGLEHWPAWGPSVRSATLAGERFEAGTTGTVVTVLGVPLDFELTEVEPGVRWTWRVAGVDATDHRVDAIDDSRCRVSFGVPWPAAPYLVVCRRALSRLDELAGSPSRPTHNH